MPDDVIIPDPDTGRDPIELRVNRRQTLAFIAANKEDITITRGGGRAPDGAGGWTKVPVGDPIPPQAFRLIPQGGNVQARNIDGEQIKPAYVMIGAHDADIKIGDTFTHSSRDYDVIFVREDRDYETWAEVVHRG